jgi:hypothetical protein
MLKVFWRIPQIRSNTFGVFSDYDKTEYSLRTKNTQKQICNIIKGTVFRKNRIGDYIQA